MILPLLALACGYCMGKGWYTSASVWVVMFAIVFVGMAMQEEPTTPPTLTPKEIERNTDAQDQS